MPGPAPCATPGRCALFLLLGEGARLGARPHHDCRTARLARLLELRRGLGPVVYFDRNDIRRLHEAVDVARLHRRPGLSVDAVVHAAVRRVARVGDDLRASVSRWRYPEAGGDAHDVAEHHRFMIDLLAVVELTHPGLLAAQIA